MVVVVGNQRHVISGLTRPHHFWFAIPHLDNVQMLGKNSPHSWATTNIEDTKCPWHQAMQTRESVVHVNTVMAKIQQASKCLKFITRK
jgi:hypothetical protein